MNRLSPDERDARFIRRVLILIVLGGVAYAMWRAENLLILMFGSVLGAVVIRAIAASYCRMLHVPMRIAVPAAMVTTLLAIAFLVWLFGVQFEPQIEALITRMPELLADLKAWLSRTPVGAKVYAAGQAAFAGSRVAQDLGGLAEGSAEMVLNIILLIAGSLFIAADPRVYERGLLLLVPPAKRAAADDALHDVATTLRLWLRAQIILMTTMGVLVGVGLWVSDVPSPAALGLLAGLSEFIPYIGPTAAMLPALGLGATAGTGPLIGALVTFAVVRLVQTNLITPFVQNRVISIPPAITLFAIIGIGVVFGMFGLFFSAALLVVIFSLVKSLYLREVLGEPIPVAERPNRPDSPQ